MLWRRMTDTQQQISIICDGIKNLLLQKNKRYGDSALNPSRIFSKANTCEQLCVRIDDKLSRISKGAGLLAADEDVLEDLIGYLVLLKIALSRNATVKTENQTEQWDGSDIDPSSGSRIDFWKTSVACDRQRKTSRLNDTEWLELYASGDKFG